MSFLALRSAPRPVVLLVPIAPTVTTSAASSITGSTATGNGAVVSDGDSPITERGFVWSTSSNPTTSDSKVTVVGATGAFSGSMTSLSISTLYHYRAYAINSLGTNYGADTTFTTTGGGSSPPAALTMLGVG